MAYRKTSKRNKVWSEQANAKQARERLANAESVYEEIDRTVRIRVERPGLGEDVLFELLEGSRIDNYSVYCNGKNIGVMGITRVLNGVRKALPSFRNMN